MTAFGNITDAVQAMKNGAYDYLVKGDDNEKIIPLVYKALEKVKDNKSRIIPVTQSKDLTNHRAHLFYRQRNWLKRWH
jgi:FixJ family two-component response regulator